MTKTMCCRSDLSMWEHKNISRSFNSDDIKKTTGRNKYDK